MKELVRDANQFLKAEANRPKKNTNPLKAQIKSIETQLKRLGDIVESHPEKSLDSLLVKMDGHERRIKELRALLREAEAQNAPVAPPLTLKSSIELMTRLRDVLRKDVEAAAAVLRELTGPIVVTQERQEGKRGALWIAKFTVKLVPAMLRIASKSDCLTPDTWVSRCRQKSQQAVETAWCGTWENRKAMKKYFDNASGNWYLVHFRKSFLVIDCVLV